MTSSLTKANCILCSINSSCTSNLLSSALLCHCWTAHIQRFSQPVEFLQSCVTLNSDPCYIVDVLRSSLWCAPSTPNNMPRLPHSACHAGDQKTLTSKLSLAFSRVHLHHALSSLTMPKRLRMPSSDQHARLIVSWMEVDPSYRKCQG